MIFGMWTSDIGLLGAHPSSGKITSMPIAIATVNKQQATKNVLRKQSGIYYPIHFIIQPWLRCAKMSWWWFITMFTTLKSVLVTFHHHQRSSLVSRLPTIQNNGRRSGFVELGQWMPNPKSQMQRLLLKCAFISRLVIPMGHFNSRPCLCLRAFGGGAGSFSHHFNKIC